MNADALHSNLREYVNNNPPDWARNIMEEFSVEHRALIDRYAVSKYWCASESINVMDIAGTAHPDYAGKSWLNLLDNGKRMDSNLSLLVKNPGYYYEKELKNPTMTYVRIDDKTFIGEGNHRTCIARFLFHYQGLTILHGVSVKSYIIDYGFKSVYEDFEAMLKKLRGYNSLSIEKTTLSRQDTGGWYREHYELKAVLNLSDRTVKLSLNDMKDIMKEYPKPFKKFTGKYKHIWRVL
jgi:hypothetical protein